MASLANRGEPFGLGSLWQCMWARRTTLISDLGRVDILFGSEAVLVRRFGSCDRLWDSILIGLRLNFGLG